jgi:16S rRNA (cytosine1407-C5)-methyltransferase
MKNRNSKVTKLPDKFIERLQEIVGVSLCSQIEKTFAERPTTFRINTIKTNRQEVRQFLQDNGFKFEQVLWYKDAFILKNKSQRDLQETDLYQEGKIYLQSLASMVPPLVLDPQVGEKVLDLTAAPGSKTSQIAALMNKQGELVANDINPLRFEKLKYNMELLGVANTPRPDGHPSQEGKATWNFILKNENGVALTKEYPEYFDKILLDAPCTAEARIIIGKPATSAYWNERNIKDTAYLQRQLLFSAWQMLKPGGVLVYSTCTFAPEENELQITKFMERNSDCEILPARLANESVAGGDIDKLPIIKNWKEIEINKDVIKKALRIMPTKEIEGFFVVRLKKH